MIGPRNHLVLRTLLPDSVTILVGEAKRHPDTGASRAMKRRTIMKRNFAMLAAAAAFSALPAFAFAADAIDEIPAAPDAPAYEAPQAAGWAGAYGGVNLGHGWARHDAWRP